MNEDDMNYFVAGFIICAMLFAVFMLISSLFDTNLCLSQETGEDVCRNLFPNQTMVVPSVEDGRLICEVPSYDHTINIIMREAR